jgi:CheY-like chemotaxis protein
MGSSEERRLEVSTRQDGKTDRIIMTVGDTGSGIAPENISRIFEPFFTTKPVGVGTGVGLSVCHGILTAHDATIEVQSEIGKGTHFRIEFPIPDELPKPHAKEAKPDRTVSSAAVLVVDDEQDVLEMLAEILTNAGHKVATASSGREAVTLLEQREFDLIASDIKMPDMDGRQLVQIIEDRFPSMQDRIILITGDVLGAEVETFASERGLQYLEKPFVPSEVRDIVGELVLKVRNRT